MGIQHLTIHVQSQISVPMQGVVCPILWSRMVFLNILNVILSFITFGVKIHPLSTMSFLPQASQCVAGMTSHELLCWNTNCHSDRAQAALTFVKAQPVLVSFNVRQINRMRIINSPTQMTRQDRREVGLTCLQDQCCEQMMFVTVLLMLIKAAIKQLT